MPAARGVKRTASKTSAATASKGPANKKKRGAIQLEIPVAPKSKGCVMTCGQGDVGQLGLGEDVIETTKFKVVSALGNKIVDVIAGGMHTIALDSDGKVWTFGCNDEGALGRPTANETDEGTPKIVTLPLPAVAISAGDSHSAVLLENGDVYSWGAFRDSHGSMGLVVRGREGKPCKEPVRVDIGELAVGVASGGDHLVILSCTGSVYTMGCGEQGQLGRLSQRSASRDARQGFSALLVPSKVILKGGASRVWAGYHATFALDGSSDKMFAWGLNNYGQLGITGEKRKTAIYTPTECDAMRGKAWRSISAGQHHSLAIDERGDAHSVGRCEYGRLGLGDRAGDAETWEVIPKLQNKKSVSIAAGTSNSFAVTEAGEAFSWGMGSEGQLGAGGTADLPEPTLAPTAGRAYCVAAGGQHTALLVAREDSADQMEVTPAPESDKEEEKAEPVEEKKRPNKRQKKQEQDEEISSTSSAQPADVKDEPEKVNGNEKKDTETETPMEVDDTDKPQDKEETTDNTDNTDEQSKEQIDDKQETEQTDTEIESKDMDTSSQDTVSDHADEPELKPEERPEKPDELTEKPEVPDTVEVNGQPVSA